MRSSERDQGGTIRVSAYVVDAASGSGIARGGGVTVPFTFTRGATGDYTYNFPPAVVPTALTASSSVGAAPIVSWGTGTFRIQTFSVAGAATNAQLHWTLTALDKR